VSLAHSLLIEEFMSKPIPSISKYMTTTPQTVAGNVTLAAASKLMQERGIRHLPVMDGGKLLGVITERDIRYVASFSLVDPEKVTVSGAMSEDLYTVAPETPLDQVVGTMAEKKYGSAIVVQNEHVVGVFTTVDACRALSELLSTRLRG
jgi:acetoin utilization protein AcuB